ncbi:hypothetical protein SAMN05428978_103328 [Nitrosomonas sp. Nm34]|nr:hypothetical protein SAMN05428978_103328 [Nitrosomonas sp. Nm34]
MRSTIKVKPLPNFHIKVTWLGGLYTSTKMIFPNSSAAQTWARDQFGIEPKIRVEPCAN